MVKLPELFLQYNPNSHWEEAQRVTDNWKAFMHSSVATCHNISLCSHRWEKYKHNISLSSCQNMKVLSNVRGGVRESTDGLLIVQPKKPNKNLAPSKAARCHGNSTDNSSCLCLMPEHSFMNTSGTGGLCPCTYQDQAGVHQGESPWTSNPGAAVHYRGPVLGAQRAWVPNLEQEVQERGGRLWNPKVRPRGVMIVVDLSRLPCLQVQGGKKGRSQISPRTAPNSRRWWEAHILQWTHLCVLQIQDSDCVIGTVLLGE